ncbi:hypothetical protein V8D89_006451 [Ganoderma adspersum]
MLVVSQHFAQEVTRKSREVLRRSTVPSSWHQASASAPEATEEPAPDTKVKKNRLSWLRSSGRRSGLILRTSIFRHSESKQSTPTASPVASPTSSNEGSSSSSSSDSEDNRASVDVATDERSRALDILEGRSARPDSSSADAPLARTATRIVTRTASEPSPAPVQEASTSAPSTPTPTPSTNTNRMSGFTLPAAFINSLPFAGRSRSRSGSVASRRSLESPTGVRPGSALSVRSTSPARRPSSRLDRVPEDRTIVSPPLSPATPHASGSGSGSGSGGRTSVEEELVGAVEQDEQGLPTYASAAYPSRPMGYRFVQAGPFAMTLCAEGEEEVAGLGRYHVGVGVNVWSPRLGVTSVRRGLAEDGPMVAEIEFGSTSLVSPALVMGDEGRPLKEVLSRSLTNGSRTYHIGDGTTIVWKLSRSIWKASMNSIPIATFCPNPPRSLVVQPLAHKYMDHILIGALLLMRDKDAEVFDRPDYSVMPLPFV